MRHTLLGYYRRNATSSTPIQRLLSLTLLTCEVTVTSNGVDSERQTSKFTVNILHANSFSKKAATVNSHLPCRRRPLLLLLLLLFLCIVHPFQLLDPQIICDGRYQFCDQRTQSARLTDLNHLRILLLLAPAPLSSHMLTSQSAIVPTRFIVSVSHLIVVILCLMGTVSSPDFTACCC